MSKNFRHAVSRRSVIGAVAMCLLLTIMAAIVIPPIAGAQSPSPTNGGPLLDSYDLTGDGVPDLVQGYPDGDPAEPGNVPGEVHIISGATGETLLILEGEEDGDRFGHAIAYAGDLNRNGHIDLVIGAPSANAVAVVSTNLLVVPNLLCPVDDPVDPSTDVKHKVRDVAIQYLATDSLEIYDAGDAVAAFYDFREDSYPTFRFTAKYLNDDNEEATREYIVHGYTGLIMARVERYIQRDGIERPRGDTTRDGQVHDDDLDVVLANLGESGESLTIDDGDVTGDQQVGPEDLIIVMTEQGRRLYDPTPDAPPTTFNPQDEGCDAYYARGDEGQWYHIELFGLGCVGPVGSALSASDFPCDDAIVECCGEGGLEDCEHDGIKEAIDLIDERCSQEESTEGGGTSSGTTGGDDGGGDGDGGTPCEPTYETQCTTCDDPPDNFEHGILPAFGWTTPQPDNCHTVVIICLDRGDPCTTLAHELTHHSQNCVIGFEDPNFWDIYNNNCNMLCAELEAHCIGSPFAECQDCESNGHACCERVCEEHRFFDCNDDCATFCDGASECCEGGLNTCDDPICDGSG